MASLSSRTVASLGLTIAVVAALGYALATVPNVELMGLATFVAGGVLGAAAGAVIGCGAMAIFSLVNPFGIAPPPVFVMQLLGLSLFGVAGGWLSGWLRASGPGRVRASGLAGAAGLVLTLAYDGLTNLGVAATVGALRDPWPVLVGGLVFGVWHVAWNTVFFAVGVPPLVIGLCRRREALL
jgi:hypothetical protein